MRYISWGFALSVVLSLAALTPLDAQVPANQCNRTPGTATNIICSGQSCPPGYAAAGEFTSSPNAGLGPPRQQCAQPLPNVPPSLAPAPAAPLVPVPITENPNAGVQWNGIVWRSMPNITWASCDVSATTRSAIDAGIAQWRNAESNQGVPVHLSEVPCTNGDTKAQILITEAPASELPSGPESNDFGLVVTTDANNQVCGVDVLSMCDAQVGIIFLFPDNIAAGGLTTAQAGKVVAGRLGSALGLRRAPFCNFDSVMANNCAPILTGLGPDDVEGIEAIVDDDNAATGRPASHTVPQQAQPAAGGNTITYIAGWNLVAGPRGTSFSAASGSLNTFLPRDTSYLAVSPSEPARAGFGYWAYFPQQVGVQLNGPGRHFVSVVAPAGQWFLLGNADGTAPMQVLGADAVDTWDASRGTYQQSTTLQPGQAAWVYSAKGDLVAEASLSLSAAQVACYLNLGDPSTCESP